MKKIIVLGIILLIPFIAYATPVPWDGDFGLQELETLASFPTPDVFFGSTSSTAAFSLFGTATSTSNVLLIRGQTFDALALTASGVLTVPGAVFNELSASIGDFRVESNSNTHQLFVDYSADCIGINKSDCSAHTLAIVGHTGIEATATENDAHALQITANAAGYGDYKGIDLDYITGAIGAGEDEEVILVNIDEGLSTSNSRISAFECLTTTTGGSTRDCLNVGVGLSPIVQHSGTFGNLLRCEQYDDSMSAFTDCLTAFNNTGTDVTLWPEDNDIVYIAFSATANFEAIEWIFDTVATNPGIQPIFEFPNATAWTTFSPTDGTNGARNTGIMNWSEEDNVSWTATTVDSDSAKWIRIKRTANNITSPIEDLVQVASPTDFTWNLTADLTINTITFESAGVKFSADDDGAFTVLGLGDGFAEDFTLNLDDTSNTGVWTSSTGLNVFNFSGIALQESGINVLNNDEIDASSELLAIIDDETGTGLIVFGTSPTFLVSIVIPQGTAPTVDAVGEIAVDTTDDQFVYYGGAKRVIPYEFNACPTIEALAAADDNIEILTVDDPITITGFGIRCVGTCTTTASTTIQGINTGVTMTKGQLVATTGTSSMVFNSVTADNALAAGNTLLMSVTNTPNPETDRYHICVKFTFDAQ